MSEDGPARSSREDRPLDLLLVSALFPPLHTGAGRQAESVLRQLHGMIRARVVTLAAPELPRQETRDGLEIERIGSLAARRPARDFGVAATKYLATCPRPDVIWALGVGPATYAAIVLGRARGIPVVVKLTLEGQDDPATLRSKPGGAARFRCLAAASAVVCPSEELVTNSLDAGLDPERLQCIPNGVDGARFVPGEHRDPAQIVFVGAVEERKGLHLVVDAIAELAAEQRSARLVVVGDWRPAVPTPAQAEYVERLRARIALPELRDRITILGPVERPEEVLAASSIFVLPSSAEGLPNALLEAMAAGLVPVVSDLPALREVVSEETGVRVGEASPRAWSDALNALLRDPAGVERMGRAARAIVTERFDLAVVARCYLDLFRRLGSRRAARLRS